MKKSTKLILLLALACYTSAPADAQLLANSKIKGTERRTTQKKTIPLKSALTGIETRFKVSVMYDSELVDSRFVAEEQINLQEADTEASLRELLKDTDLIYRKVSNIFYIIRSNEAAPLPASGSSKASEQSNVVWGKVTTAGGEPLPGVTVVLKGNASIGTATGVDGSFSLNLPSASGTLVFSFIGYEAKEMPVEGQTAINVVLQEDAKALEEVVVTALGIKRDEKALGYSIQKVSGEQLQTVKSTDVATSLTGQVSGLVVKNSTEFFAKPTVELRGEGALLVIDGVPYGNMTLRDIPADDIASMDVLKGPTASALYGSRASGGVILITTKKGTVGKGLSVNINSNTMLQTGFLAIPEVQGSYGRGTYGELDNDYVWGPRLDAGNTARNWNPVTKQFEDDQPLLSIGKDNLKNFMRTGVVTNNNISVAQSGEYGSFRASLNHIYNRGQFPNAELNMYNFTLGGELKASDKFTLESHMGVSRRTAPQTWGSGYGNQGYIYQLTMWTGPEYDIRQYRDYWKVPNQTQNWMYNNWYDNPYLIAYEKLNGIEQNTVNASLTANYKFTKDLSLMLRLGYDIYNNKETKRNPAASIFSTRGGWNARGMYSIYNTWGWSTNDDLILSYTKNVGKWNFDAMAGGTIYAWTDESLSATTRNGLTSPTFYSLNGSVEPPTVSPGYSRRQVNSLYGRASVEYNNTVFLDFTGRNDWNSSQPSHNRDYFYPSIGSSVVLSEFLNLPAFVDMWKIRGSWATFKTPAGVYETNRLYSTTTSAWNGLNSASYPGDLLGIDLLPSSQRTWEVGTAAYLFKGRLHADIAYFNKYYYNRLTSVSIPNSSGFSSTLVNTDETYERRGMEITLSGSIIQKKNFKWNSTINWSNQHRYYVNLDPVYSAENPWVKEGGRLDNYIDYYWLRDPAGNIIHHSGYPVESNYVKNYGYTDPKFSFGFINNFTIGNFIAGVNIDGRIGGLMYNYVYDKMWDSGTNPESDNQYRYDEVVNGLTNYVGKGVKVIGGQVTYDNHGNITSDTREYAENDVEVSYQNYAQNFRGGDFGVQSKSFVKLREVSVGYRLPARLLSNTGIKNASVSLTSQNVFLWTKFKFSDPDVDNENLNSPSQRIVGLNFKLSF